MNLRRQINFFPTPRNRQYMITNQKKKEKEKEMKNEE